MKTQIGSQHLLNFAKCLRRPFAIDHFGGDDEARWYPRVKRVPGCCSGCCSSPDFSRSKRPT